MRVFSSLTGRVFDAPFSLWTLRYLPDSPEEAEAERAVCERFVREHGDPCSEWASATHDAYRAEIEAMRVEAAR